MKDLRILVKETFLEYLKENEESLVPENSQMFYKVTDDLFWVRVLNGNFFNNEECDGNSFGIGCQMSIAKELCGGRGGVETYQLLKRIKQEDDYCFKVIGAVTLNVSGKYFIEFRQRGNQPPGSNSIDEFSKDQMVDLFLDLFVNKLSDFDKFSDSTSLHIPTGQNLSSDGAPNSGHGWSAKSLWYLMKNFPGKFSQYMSKVPGVFVNHIAMIEKTLGEDFLLMDKDVKEIFDENKQNFFNIVNTLIKIKKEETVDFLKTLDYSELLKDPKILKSIEDNLFLYIDFLSPEAIQYIINKLNIREFIKSSVSNFGFLCRKLSEKGGAYKKILFNFVNDNFVSILDALGGKGIGLGRLMSILNSPKYKKHEDSKLNVDSGDYEFVVTNPETNETTKKTISDENLVFNNSERKKFLEQNKESIKSFFNMAGLNPEIEFLRFLIPNLPESKSKELLDKAKNEFIDYYDKKFDENRQKVPGKFLYNQLMNQLKFRLGEKPKKTSYDWEEVFITESYSYPFKINNVFPSDLNYNDRFDKKTLQSILKFFYKELKPTYGEYKLNPENGSFSFQPAPGKTTELKQIFSDYLYVLASISGFGTEDIKNWMEILKNNKFPIVSPTPKIVSWSKGKNYFSDIRKTE